MTDSEVFRKNKRGRQKVPMPTTACKKKEMKKEKIVADEKAAKRHKSELKDVSIFGECQ